MAPFECQMSMINPLHHHVGTYSWFVCEDVIALWFRSARMSKLLSL